MRPTTGERQPPLVSKVTDVLITRGQRVRLETPGGGGFGDPRRRDPSRVARDVAMGYVSPDGGASRLRGRLMRGTSTMSEKPCVVGVDVGGTFTDLFLFDEATKSFRTAKVSSSRGDEAAGLVHGLRALGSAEAIGSIVHGTTVGTNALLERRGPKIGVITTRGFRDVLEMRRRDRRRTWGLWGDFTPIADRDLRLEVDERTLADGSVRAPVDEAAVRAAALTLRERGAAGARHLLHQRLCESRERGARARRRPRGVAERACLRLAPGAARDPRVRARLDHRAQRLSAAGGRRLSRRVSTARSPSNASPGNSTSCSRTAA